jgi:hypothetical protein
MRLLPRSSKTQSFRDYNLSRAGRPNISLVVFIKESRLTQNKYLTIYMIYWELCI